MGGRGGSAVGVVVVALGTSSYVGRMLGNRGVEGRRNPVQFFRLQKLNRKVACCCIRRCVARAFGIFCCSCFSTAAAAAAAADALRTAGWSCSVFFFFLTLLQKLYGGGCCTEPSEE